MGLLLREIKYCNYIHEKPRNQLQERKHSSNAWPYFKQRAHSAIIFPCQVVFCFCGEIRERGCRMDGCIRLRIPLGGAVSHHGWLKTQSTHTQHMHTSSQACFWCTHSLILLLLLWLCSKNDLQPHLCHDIQICLFKNLRDAHWNEQTDPTSCVL